MYLLLQEVVLLPCGVEGFLLFGGTEKSKVPETGLCVGKKKLPSTQIDFASLHQSYSGDRFLEWR